ncbi:MAG: hypothetical protein IPM58_14160 [Nitrospira sp.]|nr:hypothetical protein [Nitrospira sp.]
MEIKSQAQDTDPHRLKKNVGRQTLDDAIQDLLTKKWIAPEEAYEKSIDKNRFAKLLKTPPDALQ